MKLLDAVNEYETLQKELKELEDRRKAITIQSTRLGAAVYAAVRHLVPDGVSRVEFQAGDNQFCVEGSGILTRINQVSKVDQDIVVEVKK